MRAGLVITAGIDVGGRRKGLHGVLLVDGCFHAACAKRNARAIVEWVRRAGALIVAVDAPSCWRQGVAPRLAERELLRAGIHCYFTPSRKSALSHPKNFYGWMLEGEKLYNALTTTHPVCTFPPVPGRPCCFETFPHAITRHLLRSDRHAGGKRSQRSAVLLEAGIALSELTNADLVDAALCALAAHHAATGRPLAVFGDPASGLLIAPARRI